MEEAALPTRQSFDDLEPFRIQERHVVLLSPGETISLPYPQRQPSLSDAMTRPSNGRLILFGSTVGSTSYSEQTRRLTEFCFRTG
jgi:hypothetical protein